MRNIMALATFREALMHGFCVWQAMAIIALRYSLMLSGVTSGTSDLTVLGWARSERSKDRVVT